MASGGRALRALALGGALTILAASGGLAQGLPPPGAPGDDGDCLIAVAREAFDHPAWREWRTGPRQARLNQAALCVLVEQFQRAFAARMFARNRLPSREVLVAFDCGGNVCALKGGTARRVDFDVAFARPLAQSGADLILVHNHPGDGGLSLNDLLTLGEPGVAAIVAVGHGGSVYAASAGASMSVAELKHWEYQRALERVRLELSGLRATRPALGPALVAHTHHLVAMALARVGVIRYEARLGFGRAVSYNQVTPAPAMITLLAAEDLKRAPRR